MYTLPEERSACPRVSPRILKALNRVGFEDHNRRSVGRINRFGRTTTS